MPNLDELTHDMTFTIGGETFVVHDVSPDVLLTLEEEEGEEAPKDEEERKSVMQRVDEQILMFLGNGDGTETEDMKRYKAMRERTTDIVPLWKLLEFRRLLWETQSGRPTEAPPASVGGRGATVRSSRGA